MSNANNPLAPFIKGELLLPPLPKVDFFKSPLEKGDSGGCLVCYATNFEIPVYKLGLRLLFFAITRRARL